MSQANSSETIRALLRTRWAGLAVDEEGDEPHQHYPVDLVATPRRRLNPEGQLPTTEQPHNARHQGLGFRGLCASRPRGGS